MVVSDLINYTLRLAGILGVGQSPLAQDEQDAQTTLALMAQQWQRKRWLVFRLDDLTVQIQPWKTSYTIGTSEPVDIIYPRPGTIETATLRQLTGLGVPGGFPVDYPLQKIWSREEWNSIPLKRLGSWPARFFYDPTLPNGTIYLWPIPIQTLFELHIAPVQSITALPPGQEITDIMPPEAQEALAYNLATRLRVNYRLPPDPSMISLALASLNTLRTLNFGVRTLRMPVGLAAPSRVKNPMAGFYPEANAGIPFPVLS